MNGRVHDTEDTPAGRIAAVAKSLCMQMEKTNKEPDYADFKEVLAPFIEYELISARVEEVRTVCGRMITARVMELAVQLRDLKFPDQYDLRKKPEP